MIQVRSAITGSFASRRVRPEERYEQVEDQTILIDVDSTSPVGRYICSLLSGEVFERSDTSGLGDTRSITLCPIRSSMMGFTIHREFLSRALAVLRKVASLILPPLTCFAYHLPSSIRLPMLSRFEWLH